MPHSHSFSYRISWLWPQPGDIVLAQVRALWVLDPRQGHWPLWIHHNWALGTCHTSQAAHCQGSCFVIGHYLTPCLTFPVTIIRLVSMAYFEAGVIQHWVASPLSFWPCIEWPPLSTIQDASHPFGMVAVVELFFHPI